MNVGKRTDRGEVVGGNLQHRLELGARFVEVLELYQRAPERDLRRQVPRMPLQPIAADLHGFDVVADPAVLLGQLRKRDRRGVLVHPPAQLVDPPILAHTLNLSWQVADKRKRRDGSGPGVCI